MSREFETRAALFPAPLVTTIIDQALNHDGTKNGRKVSGVKSHIVERTDEHGTLLLHCPDGTAYAVRIEATTLEPWR